MQQATSCQQRCVRLTLESHSIFAAITTSMFPHFCVYTYVCGGISLLYFFFHSPCILLGLHQYQCLLRYQGQTNRRIQTSCVDSNVDCVVFMLCVRMEKSLVAQMADTNLLPIMYTCMKLKLTRLQKYFHTTSPDQQIFVLV